MWLESFVLFRNLNSIRIPTMLANKPGVIVPIISFMIVEIEMHHLKGIGSLDITWGQGGSG